MEKNANNNLVKKELTPLERRLRNSVVRDLSDFGINNDSIANILNMHKSTVSRILSKGDSE